MTDHIKAVDLGPKSDMRAAIEVMRREMPALVEYAAIMAKLRKASYDAHIDAGFSPEQALALCAKELK